MAEKKTGGKEMTEQELNKACEWLKDQMHIGSPEKTGNIYATTFLSVTPDFLGEFRNAMGAVIKESLNPEYDAEYLQSKIDAFTEARRKDGKTADEMLDDCRGGVLELTWRDVQKIVQIEESMVAEDIAGELEHLAEPEAYYTEILKRFKQ